MTIAKNQHFLPQFYLRKFTDPDTPPNQEPFVWVFELSKRCWRRKSPENVASSPHYYAYRDKNNQLINIIEPHLSSIESLGATVIRKLEAREILTKQEQVRFSFFVALLTIRTPQHRASTERFLRRRGQDFVAMLIQHWRENPEEFEALKRNYHKETGKDFDISIDEFEQHAPFVMPDEGGKLGYALIGALGLSERLWGMTWRFYYTEGENRLVICDHPGDFALPDRLPEEDFRGFFTKGAEFHIPLTPHLIFAAHDDGIDRAFGGLLTQEEVAKINKRMAQRAEQFIISKKPGFPGDAVLS